MRRIDIDSENLISTLVLGIDVFHDLMPSAQFKLVGIFKVAPDYQVQLEWAGAPSGYLLLPIKGLYKMVELKPLNCPFCGSNSKVQDSTFGDNPNTFYRVVCEGEEQHTLDSWLPDMDDAIDVWNRSVYREVDKWLVK